MHKLVRLAATATLAAAPALLAPPAAAPALARQAAGAAASGAPGRDARHPSAQELSRWKGEAADVTITRDDWGIAHVHGKTDADAVFGMEYAQAEDDFNRVETNYINAMGRLSEAEGASQVWRDLRMKLFIDPDSARARYARSPEWLKTLMDAFADGLNYYLYTHPGVHPRVIDRFEPWMALTFTEGSIGGDIEMGVDLRKLAAFYGNGTSASAAARAGGAGELAALPVPVSRLPAWRREPSGSNGIAIAPRNTLNGHALLYINPHTSFYFRSELQMSSDSGWDAYGAVTWGQFFVYQGFDRTAGWMHTSSEVDNIDQFLETVRKRGGGWQYLYGGKWYPVRTRSITVPYRTDSGMKSRTFTAYYTRHGPVIARQGDRWVSISLMQKPIEALIQDVTRTKVKDLADFRKTMQHHTNSSNNTIYADAEGHIGFFDSNYIPRRSDRFDWRKPVDGSDTATAYHGILSLDQSPNAIDPADGWVFNSNNWPWSAAGPDSPRRGDYPTYVDRDRYESPRGLHALRLLEGKPHHYTIESLTAAGFDSYQPWLAVTVPSLVKAWDALPASAALKTKLARPITLLRSWDYRWGINSVQTSLGVYWYYALAPAMFGGARPDTVAPRDWVAHDVAPDSLLAALSTAMDRLTSDFGTWQTPWGDINRFQRLDDSIQPHFDDSKPSIPVPFTSSRTGSLASFGARQYDTKKWYGNDGNSFIAAIEFGDSVRARGITAGGESGDPNSPHFDDEAVRYATGNLRVIYFYPDQLKGHTERVYHPGE